MTTLQKNIPESVRHAPERLDLAQLKATLQNVRVQEATTRGEELLRTAGDFLRDAVRVVPPTEAGPAVAGTSRPDTPRSEIREGSARSSGEGKTIATRREALLRTLRANAEILKVDPADDQNGGDAFARWSEQEAEGIDGEAWAARREAELEADGGGLKATREALGKFNLSYNNSGWLILHGSPDIDDSRSFLEAILLPRASNRA